MSLMLYLMTLLNKESIEYIRFIINLPYTCLYMIISGNNKSLKL